MRKDDLDLKTIEAYKEFFLNEIVSFLQDRSVNAINRLQNLEASVEKLTQNFVNNYSLQQMRIERLEDNFQEMILLLDELKAKLQSST
jgi:predicted secreted Zn-dependent protease